MSMPSLILNFRHVTKCVCLAEKIFSSYPYRIKKRFSNIITRRCIQTGELSTTYLPRNIYDIKSNLDFSSSHRYLSSFHSHYQKTFGKSKDAALMEDILNRVIYEDGAIVAINKPSGITVFGQKIREREDVQGYCAPIHADAEREPYSCIADIMPLLRIHFKSPELTIVHSIKMFYSGVLLMAKNKKSKDRIMQSLERANSLGALYQSYLAITVGIPNSHTPTKSAYYLKQEKIQGRVLSLPSETISRNLKKSGKIQKIVLKTTVLKKNDMLDCALVRFDTVKDKWQCLEVHCTTQLCHVLGDYLYSGRVSKIFGAPVLIQPYLAKVGKQKLPEQIQAALKQNRVISGQMPLYLHRAKVELTKMSASKPVCSILAPFPDHFLETLYHLGLEYPFEDIFKSNDKVDASDVYRE